MAASRVNSCRRQFRKYRFFFYFSFLILGIQLFMGYKFYTLNQQEINKSSELPYDKEHFEVPKEIQPHPQVEQFLQRHTIRPTRQISVPPDGPLNCTGLPKDALSAIRRAQSNDCKRQLKYVACQAKHGKIYPAVIPRFCSQKPLFPPGHYLGCFTDSQKERDLNGVHKEFRTNNTIELCVHTCHLAGYMFAGLQYQWECWCGDSYGRHGGQPETACKVPCPGNKSQTCGGYHTQRVFSTGFPEKIHNPSIYVKYEEEVKNVIPARIVFVLTVHGRAVRQVRRLLKSLYQPHHYYFIHVDSRSVYMYRELLKLEDILPNVRLARERFATIWGGASLLQAHFSFIKALLAIKDWAWDYYLNLSESDYPIKPVEQLTWFLTKYKGSNFMKANNKDTLTFIKRQGVDQVFYECDNHLWRLGSRRLPEGILFDGGSDWLALNRDFCNYSVYGTDPLIRGLREYYTYSLLPVESFFHTLSLNSEFCFKWIDNNLHLTNWKRKLGCKCQHRAQVDWCGCSPNDLKMEDMDRINAYKFKAVYFARKFEAVVDQSILNNLDNFLGMDNIDVPGISHYWESEFNFLDGRDKRTDRILSFAHSFARRTEKYFQSGGNAGCTFTDVHILETHVLYVADTFYRYLVKFNVTLPGSRTPITVETQLSRISQYSVINPFGPIGKLKSLEVGTDFDLKELIFRNYARLMDPGSDPVLRYEWGSIQEAHLTAAWIDPTGLVVEHKTLKNDKESLIDHINPQLATPLRPGVWTVELLSESQVAAEVKFLVLPDEFVNGAAVSMDEALREHNGPSEQNNGEDLERIQKKLGVGDRQALLDESVINGRLTGVTLQMWIDKLTAKFWTLKDACSTRNLGHGCPVLERCADTSWSSMSPDSKSEINNLSDLKV